MSSPTTEVKPSQVAQLMKENAELKAENDKVKQEMATMYKIINNDEREYELSQDQPLLSMVVFNITIMLDKFKEMGEVIQKLKVYINRDDEEEEGLQMVMFEGKEYYVDTYDDDVYDTSHEIVGSWDGKKIIFKEDTENIVKDVVNDIIDEVLDKSLP